MRRALAILLLAGGLGTAGPLPARPADGPVGEAFPLHAPYLERLIAQAEAYREEIERRNLLIRDGSFARWLSAVGATLAPPPADGYVEYRFHLLRDGTPNAFALPDGQIYVHTGMLAWLETEAQLRALLAHEISHVAGHHALLAAQTAHRREIASTVVSGMLDFTPGITPSLADLAQGFATQLSLAGYRRRLEFDADSRGLDLLRAAGGDPSAMPGLFEHLRESAALQPEGRFAIGGSHPDLSKRLARLREAVPDAADAADAPEAAKTAWARFTEPLIVQTVEEHIDRDLPHAAVELARVLVARLPGSAPAQVAAADAWRALGPLPTWPGSRQTRAQAGELARRTRHMTREERREEALRTPEGRVALARHLAESESHYRRALALEPAQAAAWRGLGEIAVLRGRKEEAAHAFLRYLRLAPDAADAPIVLERALALAGGHPAAPEAAARAGTRVAVLPPRVEVLQKQVGADQYRSDRARDYELAAARTGADRLRAAGCEVRVVTREDLAGDSALLELVRRTLHRHEALHPLLDRRGVRRGRFTLGMPAQVLARALDVDSIVVQHVDVTAAAWGQLTRAVLLSTLTFMFRDITGAVSSDLTVVDGWTGLVTGYERAGRRIVTRRALNRTDLAGDMTRRLLPDAVDEQGAACRPRREAAATGDAGDGGGEGARHAATAGRAVDYARLEALLGE